MRPDDARLLLDHLESIDVHEMTPAQRMSLERTRRELLLMLASVNTFSPPRRLWN